MRELQPYKTLLGAQRALDNGGRFYNMFARSKGMRSSPAFHWTCWKSTKLKNLQSTAHQWLNLRATQEK
jgi:hypothetical protein